MLSKAVASRPRLRVLLAILGVMGGVLILVSAVAQAKLVRPYTGSSFGPEGLGAGTFSRVKSIAVDQSTGDVYVFDQEARAIYKFTGAGAPVDFSSSGTNAITGVESFSGGAEQQIAVDGSSGPDKGDIYLANNGGVAIYSAGGEKLGELSGGEAEGREACGVAVDPAGAVYVGFYPRTVNKYVPSANPVTKADYTQSLSGLEGICNVAVDGEGDVYAAHFSGGVKKYPAIQFGTLEAEGTLIDENGATLATDPSTNHVLVDEGNRVAEFDVNGASESVAGEHELENSLGVALDSSTGNAYVGTGGRVEVFASPVFLPEATTEAPSSITSTGGTINGSVNPEGITATYQFQYGTSTSYGSVTPAVPGTVGSDSTSHHLAASLTGLTPSSIYHYRIIATNANGTSYGADQILDIHGPPTITFEGEPRATQHTAKLEFLLEPHGLDTHYEVEYGQSTAYGASTPSIDLGSEPQVISAQPEVTGLTLSTTYHARLVLTNSEGTTYGRDQVIDTLPLSEVSKEVAYGVGSSSATLEAHVDNDGETAATYRFEYGTTSSYGMSTSTVAFAGSPEPIIATARLSELQPSTIYHFRLVVEDEAGTVDRGRDVTFTTEPTTAPPLVLPDGRGYEKVSPNANAGGDVYQDIPLSLITQTNWTLQPFLVAAGGNVLAYMGSPSEHGGIGSEGGEYGNQYVATRAADGTWQAVNVDPNSSLNSDVPVYKGFSPDLSVGFVDSNGSSPLAEGAPGEGYSVLYARSFNADGYDPLVRTKPPHRAPGEFGAPANPSLQGQGPEVAYAGSSADLSHELFMANDTLTTNAVDGGADQNNLYDSSNGTTTLVNVLPSGNSEANATFGGPALPFDEKEYNYPVLAHDISESGNRIFWTDLNTGDLYVRENDTAPQSPLVGGLCTVPGDACTVLIAEQAQFWNATPDGSKVLYSAGGDLYERDLENGQTTDLAPHSGLDGVVAASQDLSYVYFVANAALAPGAEQQHCVEGSESSGCNLYVVHLGEPTRFIGLLNGHDNDSKPESLSEHVGDWQGSLSDSESETTPDGGHLLFVSSAPLTGYENNTTSQVFMYDFADNQIACLSCKPSGERIKPPAEFQLGENAYLPVSHVSTALPHWMSDDGGRVFFDTSSSLVPQDINGQTDVYEWERDGAGSCTRSPGCIYLLSDGTAPEGSYLIGASASGNDVFMTTRSALAPEDENETVDVYDVRADIVRRPTAPQCTGSGCQGLPSTPPVFATPPSVTYNGIGNFTPAVSKAAVPPKPLTRAQKLAKALKACRPKSKKKRAACEAQARRKYGPLKKKHPSSKRGNVKLSSKGSK